MGGNTYRDLIPHIAESGQRYPFVSEPVAQSLPNGFAFSSKTRAQDYLDGDYSRGIQKCIDFTYAVDRQKQFRTTKTNPQDNDRILAAIWENDARFRGLRYKRSTAVADGARPGGNDYYTHMRDYITGNVSAAFPQFELYLNDPSDSSFNRILLAAESETSATSGFIFGDAPLFANIQTRRQNLVVELEVKGNVPDNSWLWVGIDVVLTRV